eukprot:8502586-Pyramimonas_sp.AAC.1
MNSRLHKRCAGEEDVFGPRVFGNPSAELDAANNQELLVETCRSMRMVVANTFIERPVHEQ